MSIERLTPGLNDNFGTIEHLHRYALAMELCKGKKVLDIASGEGYGSNLLASVAADVTGIDISEDAISVAKKKYQKNNLKFVQGSATQIPIESKVMDVVVSFETIEHLVEQEQLLSEFKRVLKDDGVLIISSPAKEYYSLKDPDNPYHLKELTTDELIQLCKQYFTWCDFLYERIVVGTVISTDRNTGFQGSFASARYYDGDKNQLQSGKVIHQQQNFNVPFFVMAVCSNIKREAELPALSFFDGTTALKSEIDYLKGSIASYQNSRILKFSKKLKGVFGIK
ncbi:MAG: class I SAM-dependent methyltransferase [Chitinophagaceae bacterium]